MAAVARIRDVDFPENRVPIEPTQAGGVLTIDLHAIRSNYRRLVVAAAGAEVAGVVKADGYGLGAVPVARALWVEGCRTFFVAQFSEALELKSALPPTALILVLNGIPSGSETACIAAGILPVLNSLQQVKSWGAAAAGQDRLLPAALQVDSGMSRLGLSDSEVEVLMNEPDRLRGIDLVLVMSHLACADEPEHPANAAQRDRFVRLSEALPQTRRSLANSAGIFLGSAYHFDLVRPGIALYGAHPTGAGRNPMQPVVKLEARIIQIREIPSEAGIGYGFSQVATGPMRLATVGIGYADGWHRCLGGRRSAVWYGDQRLPIVGRISMDSIIVDASGAGAGDLKPDDLVELIGPHQTLEAIATAAGTISYEILTSLGRRFERRYVD